MKVINEHGQILVNVAGVANTTVTQAKFIVVNETDGLSYTIRCKNSPSGVAVLFLDSNGSTRIIDGVTHILNETDGLWYPLTAVNHPTTGVAMLQLGTGVPG